MKLPWQKDGNGKEPARVPTGEGVILKLDAIHTYYGTIHALKGISLEVKAGEIVTLIGANGAGKSTTLRSINGLNRPRQGTIEFNGRNITRDPAHDIVRRGISQSPEGRKLFPRMSVLENLEMGAFQRSNRTELRDDLERVYALFPRLSERKQQRAGTLSGGEPFSWVSVDKFTLGPDGRAIERVANFDPAPLFEAAARHAAPA